MGCTNPAPTIFFSTKLPTALVRHSQLLPCRPRSQQHCGTMTTSLTCHPNKDTYHSSNNIHHHHSHRHLPQCSHTKHVHANPPLRRICLHHSTQDRLHCLRQRFDSLAHKFFSQHTVVLQHNPPATSISHWEEMGSISPLPIAHEATFRI